MRDIDGIQFWSATAENIDDVENYRRRLSLSMIDKPRTKAH